MTPPLEAIARTIVCALAASIAYSAILAAVVAIAIRVTGASASTRHVLWWLALLASAAIPLASVASSLARIEWHAIPQSAATLSGAAGVARAANAERTRYAGEAIAGIWLAIALAGGASLGASVAALRAMKRSSHPIDERVLRRLRRFRRSASAGRAASVRVSGDIDVPAAVGFRSPVILLPARLAAFDEPYGSEGDLDRIVLHEYAHLERYDDWTNALQLVIERAFWFNPFVAFFASRIALAREIACDDWVVARTGRAGRYATCLWNLAESVHLPARRPAAPGALFSARAITVRIERLLDARRSTRTRVSPVGAAAFGALALVTIVAAAVRAPAIGIDVAAAQPNSHVASVPAPALTPLPLAHARRSASIVLHRVPVEATPGAIARAVAREVATSAHADVETRVSRHATGAGSYEDEIGIDIARDARAAVPRVPATAVARASAHTTLNRTGEAKHPAPPGAIYGRRAQS